MQQLATEVQVTSLAALPNGQVIAGTNPSGKLFKSSDYGQTWTVQYDSPEQTIYTLNTLGSGVVIAGTGPGCKVYRSVDYGVTWALVQALGAEMSIRSFITLGNGATLAGTGEHALVYKSLNCAADLDVIHNLGFLPSEAVEPSAYFQLAQPKFDPFPVHLKYQSSDYIRVTLPSGNLYDFTCAQVTEILDLKQKSMPWRMLIQQTEWLSNTAGGPLPSTIERVAAYTPLVTANFNKNLNAGVNNLQAFADFVDDMELGSGSGDMLKSTYDTDNDGVVDAADAVPWSGVSGKPTIGDMLKSTYDTDNDGVVDAAEAVPWSGVSGAPVVAGGTYTPSLYKDSNVNTFTLCQDFQYMRGGNQVWVDGAVIIKASAAGYFTAGLTLPVASALVTSYDLNGNATLTSGAAFNCASVIGDVTTHRAQINGYLPDNTNTYYTRVVFSYLIK